MLFSRKWLRPVLLALVSFCVLAVSATGRAATAAAGDLVIDHAWSRATVGVGATGVIYMTITNNGAVGDRLIGLTSPIAGRAEVHETRSDASGMVTMSPVPDVAIPPHGRAEFKPSGLHVMLTDLHKALAYRDHFVLELTFEHAGVVPVTVTVQKAGTRAFDAMGDMKM